MSLFTLGQKAARFSARTGLAPHSPGGASLFGEGLDV
jgi:hypothetical protein